MFKRKAKKESTNTISIQVNRDSVCMGDDCNSHEANIVLPENMLLSELLQRLAGYVPSMKNVIWAVQSDELRYAVSNCV